MRTHFFFPDMLNNLVFEKFRFRTNYVTLFDIDLLINLL